MTSSKSDAEVLLSCSCRPSRSCEKRYKSVFGFGFQTVILRVLGGLWLLGYKTKPPLRLTTSAGMTAPNSAERRVCWDARDLLWKCLDDNNDKAESCQKLQSDFEAKCPAQWVKYFTKRRDFLKYKERIQTEGFSPAEGPRENS